ncbi:MAG: alpha/beta hydrolase [Planctomycetes bacterium]|nr:alpha/beta hydrolase [Planctomycetota bacterium]
MACLLGCAQFTSVSPLAQLERSLIFQPSEFPEEKWSESETPFEDAWFTTPDGQSLHGLFLPHPNPRAIALFCHGNAGNVVSRTPSLWLLNQRHGLAVMTFDYRGYGRSEGTPSERGILADARAARTWLAQRTNVPEREIVLLGRSLGAAVAVDLASQDDARGLVLASTFTSLPDVAAQHMPWTLPHVFMTHRLNSEAKIKRYHGPLLQSHGDADELIPIELAMELFKSAPGPKQFVAIHGAGHNDPQNEDYRQAFDRFLDSLPPAAAPRQVVADP